MPPPPPKDHSGSPPPSARACHRRPYCGGRRPPRWSGPSPSMASPPRCPRPASGAGCGGPSAGPSWCAQGAIRHANVHFFGCLCKRGIDIRSFFCTFRNFLQFSTKLYTFSSLSLCELETVQLVPFSRWFTRERKCFFFLLFSCQNLPKCKNFQP